MKFPFIAELIYGVKFCNTTSESDAQQIRDKLFVGMGVLVCSRLISESLSVGENITSAKKQTYIKIFEGLNLLYGMRDKYNSDGYFVIDGLDGLPINDTSVINVSDISPETLAEIRLLIMTDKLMDKTIPLMTALNPNYFNNNQTNNLLNFLFNYFNESENLMICNTYRDGALPSSWGMVTKLQTAPKNYVYNYFKYKLVVETSDSGTYSQRYKRSRFFNRVKLVRVVDEKVEFTLDYQNTGEELYNFSTIVILNFLSSNTQDIENQNSNYKVVKNLVYDSATSVFKESIEYIERYL